MTQDIEVTRIGLVGFGEAGSILGEELVKRGCKVATYDILLDAASTREALRGKAGRAGVSAVDSLNLLIEGDSSSHQARSREQAASLAEASGQRAESTRTGQAALGASGPARPQLIISAVTATSSADVARGAARLLASGQIFLDLNSVAPATKRGNAEAVEASGADYVEAAVMAPVPPQRLGVPMLLGGRRASQLANTLRALGMNTTAIAEEIGIASAVKMCRSIIIKGLEALTVECTLAARKLGAEQQVLASLHASFPHMGWSTNLPDYLVSRVAEHGRRRAAEMREVARTLEDIGMQPMMASAIAERQDWLVNQMTEHGIEYPRNEPFSWRTLADALK